MRKIYLAMVFKKKVSVEPSARIDLLLTDFNILVSEICKKYPQLSRVTMYQHARKTVPISEKRKKNKGGRPPKLDIW